MKKRSINGNHINMIKGRLGGEGIDSDAAPWSAMSTSNMLMNRNAKTEVGRVDGGEVRLCAEGRWGARGVGGGEEDWL